MSENDLAKKIRDLRSLHGLTLEQVARYVGVGKSTVRKWETGVIANMRRDKIAKLATALHTTPAYLMGWEDEPSTAPQDTRNINAEIDALLSKQFNFTISLDHYPELDKTFFQKYFELSADDRETVQQMVHIMHDRRKKENPPQD